VRRPYGHRLLGIDPDRSSALSEQAGRGWLGIKLDQALSLADLLDVQPSPGPGRGAGGRPWPATWSIR
jgi:hypothetical protein